MPHSVPYYLFFFEPFRQGRGTALEGFFFNALQRCVHLGGDNGGMLGTGPIFWMFVGMLWIFGRFKGQTRDLGVGYDICVMHFLVIQQKGLRRREVEGITRPPPPHFGQCWSELILLGSRESKVTISLRTA